MQILEYATLTLTIDKCYFWLSPKQILCFNKLIGEHNTKKYFKKFSFCGSIPLNESNLYQCAILMNKCNYYLIDINVYEHFATPIKFWLDNICE